METVIKLDLTEQEARIMIWTLRRMASRVNGGSAQKRRARVLKQRREEYSQQKNLDAVILAANGGKQDLLSGRAGELRRAVEHWLQYMEKQEQKATILRDVANRVAIQMPINVEL